MDDNNFDEETQNLITETINNSQIINHKILKDEISEPCLDSSQTVVNQKVEYRTMAIQTVLSNKEWDRMYAPQPSWGYLIGFTATLALSSAQMGIIGAVTLPVSKALRYQLHWGNDKSIIDFNITLMCTAAIAGIAIGSVFGGDFVKSGRRQTILQFNVIGLIGTFISFIPVFYMMCFGRFVFGFSCGVLICTTPKAIDETVPSYMVDKGFGTSTNIIINLSFMLVAVLSLMMPETEYALSQDWTWMIIFGAQIPLQICAILLHAFVYTEEPIDFNIRTGNKQGAMAVIAKVYPDETNNIHEQIYDEKFQQTQENELDEEMAENNDDQQPQIDKDSIWHALMDPASRNATWTCIAIALFNNFTGQSLICIYSTNIFEDINALGSHSRFDIKTENNFIGYSACIGAILSYYSVAFFKRKTLFVGGHFIMGALLLMSGYYTNQYKHDLVLLCVCTFIIIFQMTTGSLFFIYVSEVVSSDAVMGLCIFTQQFSTTLQSMTTVSLLNSKLGVDGLFYLLGGIQVVATLTLWVFVKESKGLSDNEKKTLYNPVKKLN